LLLIVYLVTTLIIGIAGQENLFYDHAAVNYWHIRALTEETWINLLQFNGYKSEYGIPCKAYYWIKDSRLNKKKYIHTYK